MYEVEVTPEVEVEPETPDDDDIANDELGPPGAGNELEDEGTWVDCGKEDENAVSVGA